MRTLFKSLAVAAALILPVAAQAQIGTASVRIDGHPYPVLNGGGFSTSLFNYSPNAGGGPIDFTQYVLWCIDNTRNVSVPGGPYSYDVYTFSGFAATAFGGSGDPDGAAMNRIASLLDPFQNDVNNSTFPTPAGSARVAAQNAIWANFNGAGVSNANDAYASGSWYVLYNGRQQTLAFRLPEPSIVPEPASLALLGLGLVGLVAVRRRRNV